MQNENIIENNIVVLMGRITEEGSFSHEVYGEGFYIFKLDVARLSENSDILPITVSNRLININSIKPGMLVSVKGQLRSYNHYFMGRSRLLMTAFVREIEIMESPDEKNPNQIFLNGFVCKPPVYRTTPFGREIADVLVAVNRAYGKSDYIPCIAWGRNAKFTGDLKVGDNVKIWGRIQSRTYQKKIDDTVEEKIAYEVSVSKIETVKHEKV